MCSPHKRSVAVIRLLLRVDHFPNACGQSTTGKRTDNENPQVGQCRSALKEGRTTMERAGLTDVPV